MQPVSGPMLKSRFHLFQLLVCSITSAAVMLVCVFAVARLAMFFYFSDFSLFTGRSGEIARMINHGLRYDIRTATIALAPFTTIGLLLICYPRGIQLYVTKFYAVTTLLVSLALIAVTGNFFYYATFGSYFDVFMFGLFEEDTKAVVATIWDDYPLVSAGIVILTAVLLLRAGAKKISGWLLSREMKPRSLQRNVLFVLLFFICYGFGVHGSFGKYPLERRDAQVSSLKVLNMVTPNAIMALDWAIADHKKERNYPRADDQEGATLLSSLYQTEIPVQDVSLKQFVDRTPRNSFLESNPPHVVFAVMESLGTHLMTLDNPPATDMLGAWRPYWERDFVFTRFLSDGNGTMESLARLLVASPVSNISQTRAQRTSFASNILTPFKKKGYRTLFITSGNGSWRNISMFLKGLGFDEVVEQSDLIRKYPEAKLGTWGIYDEFSFRYAQERLQDAESRNEHLFVMMLSITNHPPFTVPESFTRLPHHVDTAMQQRLAALSYSADSIVETFQYANDTVGRFIRNIEHQKLGERTIFAVTGDHNVRGVPYSDPAEMVLAHAVPFYLRIPPKYQQQLDITYNPKRVGSHKDILPTLYSISLSDTEYYRRGINLLAKNIQSPWYFGYNEELGITGEGAYLLNGSQSFRPWRDQAGLMVAGEETLNSQQSRERERIAAYKSLMNWQLNRQVNHQP